MSNRAAISLTVTVFAFSISSAFAGVNYQSRADSVNCMDVKWKPETTLKTFASMHHYTHIELPEKMLLMDDGKEAFAFTANETLWDLEKGGSHIYIKPNSDTSEGRSTTLHAMTVSGKSYDFVITRAANSTCIKVKDSSISNGGMQAALNNFMHPVARQYQEQASFWKTKYESVAIASESKRKESIKNALRRYRYHIYTRYDWDEGNSFLGTDIISDVYDDGRFTYIRLNNDNKGILAINASFDKDEKEVIQAKYDSVSKLYRVVGIYPKFILTYDDTEVVVSRENNISKGSF